jgi:hypothetical protein
MTDEQVTALVNASVTGAKVEMLERMEKVETTLLREFRKWATRIEARGRVAEASLTGFNERLSVLEERVDDIEASE